MEERKLYYPHLRGRGSIQDRVKGKENVERVVEELAEVRSQCIRHRRVILYAHTIGRSLASIFRPGVLWSTEDFL